MEQQSEKNYAEYDYTEVTVKNKYVPLNRESYPKFGWEAEGWAEAELETNAITLKFKRSRKTRNKSELTRLQRQFETAAKEITRLEKRKIKTKLNQLKVAEQHNKISELIKQAEGLLEK